MATGTCQPKPSGSRLLLVVGFLLYLTAQGYLTVSPLWNWTLTPEADDTLTYVLKSRQMMECFTQSCPALLDLRQQLVVRTTDPEATKQRMLAISRVFPVYHPLFSVLLIGVSSLGMSLMEAYRLLWCLAPAIFGLAFAYFLTTLLGSAPAGVALILLAFKVFPDTGLHHLVPSNFAMALAVILWARIISRQGRAPWSLFLGSLVLMTIHIIGVIYAAMAGMLALFLAGKENRKGVWVSVLAVAASIAAFYFAARFITRPAFIIPPLLPRGENPLHLWLVGIWWNVAQVVIENVKLAEGLWGSFPLFLGALAFGLGTLAPSRRRVVVKLLLVYGIFLGGLVFYASSHPADVLFRLWIPLVVLLFGLVGQAIWYALESSWAWWRQHRDASSGEGRLAFQHFWPVVVLAVLLGYAGEMILKGAEQAVIMAQHLREREPLALFPSQPELLLARARPGDRVLYTSLIAMDYYLIHGAMRLGAVYYHPALKGTPIDTDWLRRPDLRFAVAYQPTVYHPSFEGGNETNWWVNAPDFRFSPVGKPRKYGPAAREGRIPAALHRWMTVKVKTRDAPKTLRLNIENPRGRAVLEVVPLNPTGEPLDQHRQVVQIPARWSGWLTVDLTPMPPGSPLRLVFPREQDRYQLGGLTFDENHLSWPWAQKALLTFQPRDGRTEAFTVSFDPANLLPEPLKGRQVSVLDDRGSSVLLQLTR